MPRDALQTETDTLSQDQTREREVLYYCARCRSLVTKGQWRLSMNGSVEHVFFNPAGIIFQIICFKEAPGVQIASPPSGDFTWFKFYLWRIAVCSGCGEHLGWRYEGDGPPAIFFGLIKPKLVTVTDGPPASEG